MNGTPNIDDIFCDAVEIESPQDRQAYLSGVCGENRELRQRLDRLLEAHFRGGQIIDSPPALHATFDQTTAREAPGEQIGPYKLLEQIGEGGMGVVYLAEQKAPVRRTVALKVIKPGMDTRQVVARFEAERQALAMMNHPHIAKVLDAGATEGGRPYFVMELVKGWPITEFCDQYSYSLKQRLELFISVCQAVQHAHQKAVIHRDLKPSNVLVELHDVTAVPKVIDFGIAKATEQRLTERTLHTGFSQMVGTPLYMSPEQAELSGLDVDTRSDVYSLGVVLYELLTGTTPFASQTLREAGYDEMRRIIREVDPPKPSDRITTMAQAELSTACKRRGVDSRQMRRVVRGELDWIVMKALEKDRTRRYESASALAADIQRYLNDEPVEAGPPSVTYRMRKFVRRRKVAITAGAIVAAALVAGTAVSTWQAVEARAARRLADEQRVRADTQRKLAEKQRLRADEQRLRADANFQLARGAVTETVAHISTEPQLMEAPFHDLRRKLLSGVLPFYQEMTRQRSDDTDIEAERASAYMHLASIREEVGAFEEARADLGLALEIFQRLAKKRPGAPGYRQGLAHSHGRLGGLLDDLGKPSEAQTHLRAALDLRRALFAEAPRDVMRRSQLAESHLDFARLMRRLNKANEALQEYNAAEKLQTELAAEFPDNAKYRSQLASTHLGRGLLSAQRREWEQAEIDLRAAAALFQKVAEESPASPSFAQRAADALGNLAIVLAERGQKAESAEMNRQALAIREKLAADFPLVAGYSLGLGGDYCNMAHSLSADQPEAALAQYGRAIEILGSLLKRAPHLVDARLFLRNAHGGRSRALQRLGRFSEALADADRALELTEGDERTAMQFERAMALAGVAPDKAIAEVETLVAEGNANGSTLYSAACFFSKLSLGEQESDSGREHAARAVAFLRQAQAAGYFETPALAAHMKQDVDLQPLRGRDDYLQFVRELDESMRKK